MLSAVTNLNPAEAPKTPAPHRLPRLSPAKMYAALLAEDSQYDGLFFTGVLTTGIYCLPSCKARKPKQANVRFFPSVEAARNAGLRPCRKCHPDDFARGADPVLEAIEALVAEIRSNPAAFPDAQAIVQRSGFGATRLFELFRLHYHVTPADLLLRARLEKAKQQLLASGSPLPAIAFEAGFESLSAFHENFRRFNGLTPAVFRELPSATTFDLALPNGYPLPYLRRALGRDQQSVTERLNGDTYTTVLSNASAPALVNLRFSPSALTAEFPRGAGLDVHRLILKLTGLEQDALAFAKLVERLGLARLIAGRSEMRITQIPSAFDCLVWSVIGQQINFPFACSLRRRLVERAGQRVGDGLYAAPTPDAIAALKSDDLLPLQFSRQKAGYLIGLARAVEEGALNPEPLRSLSATRAERTLLAIRGLGPWAVNYVMMRSLGFADCLPLGDTGVSSGLFSLFELNERPDLPSVRRLMQKFSPFRSLATAHLWQLNQPAPV